MERADLETLLTGRILAAVEAEAAPATPGDVLARSTALRRAGFSPEESAVVLTQAKLRRQAAAKFGPFAAHMLFTRAGLEQATRLDVAAQHAARFRAAGVGRVADLGCGIGGDAMAFAAVGGAVLAVERDPVTAALAQYNLAAFPDAAVRTGDAETTDLADVGGCGSIPRADRRGTTTPVASARPTTPPPSASRRTSRRGCRPR